MINNPVADLVAELPEWHRSESEYSILLYTLKQDGWHRGEPAMVNDLMIRIENANGSTNDLGPIADKLLAALTSTSAERVSIPDGNPDLNLAAWMDIRRNQIGPWADYLIREVGKLEQEVSRLRDRHPAPMTVEAAVKVLMDAHEGNLAMFGKGRTLEQVATIVGALRALSGEKS